MSSSYFDQSREAFVVDGIAIPKLTYKLATEYPELRNARSPVDLVRFCRCGLVERHAEFVRRRFNKIE